MSFVREKDLLAWLSSAIEDYKVTAPREKDGVLLYSQLHSPDEVVWDFVKPVNSIKEIFFPQTETLLEMKFNGQGENLVKEVVPTEKNLIFAVRPCDAHGVTCLDAMFLEKAPQDLYYAARRQNSIIVGLACNEVGESCFCTSVGGGPRNTAGMDVMLIQVEGGFFVDLLTPKGEDIFKDLPSSESDGDIQVPEPPEMFPVPEETTLKNSFDSKIWSEQSERCISCRICAYVCPTCRCFDVQDEIVSSSNGTQEANRIRCWDSCASEAYRRIAGGHNPRANKSDRLRNRVLCKFYYYPQQYGLFACVGCGRCIEACPVGIDITEVMFELSEGVF
jgi:ferredoxin